MNLRLGENGLYAIVKNTLIHVNPDILHEELQIPLVEHSDIVSSRRESLTVIIKNEKIDTRKDYLIRDFFFSNGTTASHSK